MTFWIPVQIIVPGTIDPIAVQWGPGAKFGDTFQPVISASLVDHSIQCEGSFGSGTVMMPQQLLTGTIMH